MKGITFIGMAGCGKSAIGKRLAQALDWKFIDLDLLILEKQGISHHEYMKRHGEEALKNIGLEEKGLAGVMAERAPLYEKYADYTFASERQTREEMTEKILAGLKPIGIYRKDNHKPILYD